MYVCMYIICNCINIYIYVCGSPIKSKHFEPFLRICQHTSILRPNFLNQAATASHMPWDRMIFTPSAALSLRTVLFSFIRMRNTVRHSGLEYNHNTIIKISKVEKSYDVPWYLLLQRQPLMLASRAEVNGPNQDGSNYEANRNPHAKREHSEMELLERTKGNPGVASRFFIFRSVQCDYWSSFPRLKCYVSVIAICFYCWPFKVGSRLGSLHSTRSVYRCGLRWLLVGNSHSILQLRWKATAGALARCRSSMKMYLVHRKLSC